VEAVRPGGDKIKNQRAGWGATLVGSVVAAGLGVAINVATDLKTSVWAWLAVVVLVVAGAAVGFGADKRSRSRPPESAGTPLDPAAVNQVNHGKQGIQVHVGGSSERITVKSRSGTAGVTVGVLVIVATLAGLAAGAWLVPRPRATAAEPAADGGAAAPVWSVSMRTEQCKSGWVVPDQGQSSVPVPGNGQPPGAALGTGGRVEVTFQGVSEEAAVLHSIVVEVVRRAPPLAGLYLPGQCGSNVVPHFYAADLDSPRPQVVPKPGQDGGETIPAREFSFKVGRSDVEKIVVVPTAQSGYVEWYLHVRWSSGSRQGDLRIGDGDKPFRTTAVTGAKPWCTSYEANPLAWVAPTGGIRSGDMSCA
jgi:hypothetical protein